MFYLLVIVLSGAGFVLGRTRRRQGVFFRLALLAVVSLYLADTIALLASNDEGFLPDVILGLSRSQFMAATLIALLSAFAGATYGGVRR